MKASLAASTQICMGQQQLIQMLQASSRPSALDPEELLAGPGGGGGGLPPPPPSPPRPAQASIRRVGSDFSGGAGEEEDKSSALAAAAIALTQGKGVVGSEVGVGRELEGAKLRSQARKSVGMTGDGGGGGGDRGDDADVGEDVYQPYVKSPALFPEPDAVDGDSARQAMAMHSAAAVTRETADREDLAASAAGGGEGNKGGAAGSGSRLHLLDDDLISHSSLRREYDETFLNQPLRGEHRRGEAPSQGQQYHHRWSYGGGEGGALEGGSGDVGVDAGGLVAGHARAR